jgi:hypothetical protein
VSNGYGNATLSGISSINVCCLVPMGRRHSTGTVRLTRRRTAASKDSYPVPDWIWIGIQPKMLDPDPVSNEYGHCQEYPV